MRRGIMGHMDRTSIAVETLARTDPEFVTLCKVLYGPNVTIEDVYEDVSKLSPMPAVTTPQPIANQQSPQSSTLVRTGKKAIEGLGLGATAVGAGLGVKEIRAQNSKIAEAVEAGTSAAGPKAKKIGLGVLLAGDAAATAVQASGKRKQNQQVAKRLVPLATSEISKGVLSELTATAVDSGKRTVGALMDGIKGADSAKSTTGLLGEVKPPSVTNTTAFKVGKFTASPTGKKTLIGGTLGAAGLKTANTMGQNKGFNQGVQAASNPMNPYQPQGMAKADTEWVGEITKFDTAKRQVFGYASVVKHNGVPVTDRQGDVITPDDMEDAAYDFVLNSRIGGNMHKRAGDGNPHHVSDLIESFVVTPEKLEEMGIPADIAKSVPVGWWTGFKVWDDDAWNDVINKRLTGFSIHGIGKRVPVGEEAWA